MLMIINPKKDATKYFIKYKYNLFMKIVKCGKERTLYLNM